MPESGDRPGLFLHELAGGDRRLLGEGASVLLAVSGGGDSTALLLGTAALAGPLRLRAEVASLDHGLRKEAAAEVEDVRKRCARLGLAFHTRALVRGPGRFLFRSFEEMVVPKTLI